MNVAVLTKAYAPMPVWTGGDAKFRRNGLLRSRDGHKPKQLKLALMGLSPGGTCDWRAPKRRIRISELNAPQTHSDPGAAAVDHAHLARPAPPAARRPRARRHATPHATAHCDRRHPRAESALVPTLQRVVRKNRATRPAPRRLLRRRHGRHVRGRA